MIIWMESLSTYKHLLGDFHSCLVTNLQECVNKQSRFGFLLHYIELSNFAKFGQEVSAKMCFWMWLISVFIVWCVVRAQVSWTAEAGSCRISSLCICTWSQWETLSHSIQSIRSTLVWSPQPGKARRLLFSQSHFCNVVCSNRCVPSCFDSTGCVSRLLYQPASCSRWIVCSMPGLNLSKKAASVKE